MAGVSVYFIGSVVTNGQAQSGTITVKSTTTAAGASGPISPAGEFEVKLNVSTGDTVTFVADTGIKTTVTQIVAFPLTAGQVIPVEWDTATGVITGVGVQP